MNNIENAIRHLQSSIDICSNRITFWHHHCHFLIYKSNTTSINEEQYLTFLKIKLNKAKKTIAMLAAQQKTEKKMLAMMYRVNHTLNSEQQSRLLFLYLRNLDEL